MKVLLLGSGGRESALASGLARSPSVEELFVGPGNPGIAKIAQLESIDPADPAEVLELATRLGADLVVVGPEAPLVAGVADVLRGAGIDVFGPSAEAARIEGSKSWAKELMTEASIPTGASRTFTQRDDAVAYLKELAPPYVIKADGLAAGKGVVVTEDIGDAEYAIEERLVAGVFGEAGRSIVIEEFLEGEEASLIAFTDGRVLVPCSPAQDYKRLSDDDRGPNTGGMGFYSPVPSCPPETTERIIYGVLEPMIKVLEKRGTPFSGALYAGVALTSEGPKVIEFNARFGDPETQALIPRLDSDLGELFLASARGELSGMTATWSSSASVAVVLASEGYPGSFPTGFEISGLDEAAKVPGVSVFHAGTAMRGDDVVTAGGRVLAVSALGDDVRAARDAAYEAASAIDFQGKHLRYDIGQRAIGPE